MIVFEKGKKIIGFYFWIHVLVDLDNTYTMVDNEQGQYNYRY